VEAISLNANGLRAALRKGLDAWLEAENPDLVFIQEVKWNDEAALRAALPGWTVAASLAQKPGYSGVAVLSRGPSEPAEVPLLPPGLEGEGRYVARRIAGVTWLNLYLPSGSQGAGRQALKLEALALLGQWLDGQSGPAVVGGDWNLAPAAADVHDPRRLDGQPGYTPEERAWFAALAERGWVDAFRVKHPQSADVYSWWSMRSDARARNKGWRIDHWVTNAPERIEAVSYDALARFSDHAPLRLRWS
jgi:exodeoxyribonuclease-3